MTSSGIRADPDEYRELVTGLVKARDSGSRTIQAEAVMRFSETYVDRLASDPDSREKFFAALKDAEVQDLGFELPFWALRKTPFAVIRQHPVGHGGFHTGIIGETASAFTWVYDCGALRKSGKKALRKAVAEFASARSAESRRKVDLLFISHFDSDHVSGLDELISQTEVDTAVIPYLTELDKAAILIEASNSRSMRERLALCIIDPVTWLRSRGVKRVVVVGGSDTDGRPALTEGLDDLSTGVPVDLPAVFLDGRSKPVRLSDDGSATEAATGCAWVLRSSDGGLSDWAFVPFVHPKAEGIPDRLARALNSFLEKQEGDGPLLERLIKVLADSKSRVSLRKLYVDAGLANSNAISMSLYIGPYKDSAPSRRIALRDDWYSWKNKRVGWLLTGDANLGNGEYRRAWLSFFKPFSDRIGTLMLPHHGSVYNFDREILQSITEGGYIFACAREILFSENPFHEDIMGEVKGYHPHLVSENEDSLLIRLSGIDDLEGAASWISDVQERWR